MTDPAQGDTLSVVVRVWEEAPLVIRYPTGPRGPRFAPDRTGPLADRSDFDFREEGFAYLATDQTPQLIFFRETEVSGVWSVGVRFSEPGSQGLSAYQIAVANGFSGSEEDWLTMLEGIDGASAYQIAQSNGFVGSQSAWLASLKGEQGDPASASQHNPPQILSSSGAIDMSRDLIICNTTNFAITASVATAGGRSGREYTFKNAGGPGVDGTTNLLTIDFAGSETADGQLDLSTNVVGDSVTIQSDGSNWIITSPPTIFSP